MVLERLIGTSDWVEEKILLVVDIVWLMEVTVPYKSRHDSAVGGTHKVSWSQPAL